MTHDEMNGLIRWTDSVTTAREVLATWGYRLNLVGDWHEIPGYVWPRDTWSDRGARSDRSARSDLAARKFFEVRQDGQEIWVLSTDTEFAGSLWHEVGHAAAVGERGHDMVNWQPKADYDAIDHSDDIEIAACAWTAALLAVVGAPLDFIRDVLGHVDATDLLRFRGDECVGVLPPTGVLREALAWQRRTS